MTAARRWGFRARLTALIAGVLILGGTVLLTVQYVLVRQLFAEGISSITTGCVGDAGVTIQGGGPTDELFLAELCATMADSAGGGAYTIAVAQSTFLAEEVLSGLIAWSVALLAAFAALAVLAARWLSTRSLGRIASITATTREISASDLRRRLDLPGPADEVKELGDTIDGMLDRLSAAFDRQERFVAAASHELRTPLTTTRTALEIPLAQGRFPAEVEPDVRRALAANERSEALIATLLTLARATRAPAQPTDAVDLLDLARRALAEREGEAAALSLRAEVCGAPVLARVDAVLASIAVGNLVENAIRHNVERGRLRISGDEEGLLVENDGREMTEAEVSHLVEPFHRGDRTRLAGTGTGLGLTLADAVATALGGRLLLAPRPGGGLTARLLLPRDPRPRDPRPRA